MREQLSDADLRSELDQLQHWAIVAGRLERVFEFTSYSSGVAFAVRVAMLSEKLDHHPDSLEILWKKVRVAYVTHSAGGLTRLDFEAAAKVNALA
jgi:4a-hydroxytetrahydrobiopterin dehydratase